MNDPQVSGIWWWRDPQWETSFIKSLRRLGFLNQPDVHVNGDLPPEELQAAAEQATKGLEECEKIDAMVAKAHQDTVERKARAQLATEAEARIAQTAACVDRARQAVRNISTTRSKNADVTAAKGALDRAEVGLKQARELLTQNDPKGALGRLDTAQADCQTAQAASEKAVASTGKPRRSR